MSEKQEKKYWKSIEERENTPRFQKEAENEFPEPLPLGELLDDPAFQEGGVSRRSFLKAAGFSLTGALLAACARGPVEKAIPLLNAPQDIVVGKAYWYASTCAGCQAGCGILAKTRDGRPIKIEGNPQHPLSQGGICAVGQAMVLSLYDSRRLEKPLQSGKMVAWSELDREITARFNQLGSDVYLLTSTVTSPSTRAMIERFLKRYPRSAHVEYDAVSYAAIMDAHEQTHGQRVLPRYRFDRAEVIVSFDADFLGTWISPVEFTKGYVAGRTLEGSPPRLSYHVQLEGRMSLTGSNADRRIRVTPTESAAILTELARRIARQAGLSRLPLLQVEGDSGADSALVREIADRLWQARGKSLVVCGQNDPALQRLVNLINYALENYGKTLDISRPSYQWRGNERALFDLLEKMQKGQVKALLIADANPLYSLPNAAEFSAALKKVPLTVTFAHHLDETAEASEFVCPLSHPLESWNDAELSEGLFSMTQPTIPLLGDTRTLRECLAVWLGNPQSDREILKDYWKKHVFPRQTGEKSFQKFWDQSVHDGFALVQPRPKQIRSFRLEAVTAPSVNRQLSDEEFNLILYQKIGLLDGRHAQNPWLQELPDPVTKVTWDNYVAFSPALARRLQLKEGEVISVSDGRNSVELPVQIQPGQHDRVVAIALGYGRKGTERFTELGPKWIEHRESDEALGQPVGRNAFPFVRQAGGMMSYLNTVTMSKTGRFSPLALTQTHHTITVPKKLGGEARHMVRETTLAKYLKDPKAGNHYEHPVLQLWEQDFVYKGHHWGLAIDLNRCTGCSGCVISCQAENNVSVVGKDEVRRRREMHWIRIDRYYSGEEGDVSVMFQPVMCQHCDHAPCESVCPVLATVHSDEGINQQIYNRCVGTRYCANNCPYKVRRFNWFDYWKRGRRENLVLNPDITTRSRGVMEKCSLCVQRIQEAKAEAKRQGRELADGEIRLACEQSCPADAIVFGDMNDPESRIAKLIEHPRHYRMLEEMNFRPTVGYMTKVRNQG